MSWYIDRLRNGRLSVAAAQIEKGEPVDWRKLSQLQAVDCATAGQLALADAIEREDQADERLQQLLDT